jgi:ribose-phosphate pyrophosphokinase
MAQALIDTGARSVRAMVTHGLLTAGAAAAIGRSPLVEVVVTDSVPPPVEEVPRVRQVTLAPLFAQAIRSIHDETSISRLFE